MLCCFVCDVGSEVAADEAVPNRGEHLLELLSYRGGNLHLGVVGTDGLKGDLVGGRGDEKWRGAVKERVRGVQN